MKIKEGFILREAAGKTMVIAVGPAMQSFSGIITLNAPSVFLWHILEKGATEEELVSALLNEYEVEREVAEKDVKDFVAKLVSANVVI